MNEELKVDMQEIPLGYTYDSSGNVISFKNSNGDWYNYTRDSLGNELSYKNSDGFWRTYTRDSLGNVLSFKRSEGYWSIYARDNLGNELSYKDSNGSWCTYTRDSLGNELSYKRDNGFGGTLIGKLDNYNFYWDQDNDTFSAGCRNQLSREQALKHWDRDDARAILATLLILATGEIK